MSGPEEIQSRLLEFLRRDVFSVETSISEDTDLIASGFDSVSLVNLMLFVEQTYGLWLPEREITAATFKNTRSLATVVSRLLHEHPAAS
jgi:diaminopimelate decarboxylase